MPYTAGMALRETSSGAARPPIPSEGSLWERISEGRRLDELWSQLSADTRATYGFYGRDIDWDHISKLPWWHRPLHIAKGLFLAMFYKLTPPRRIILLTALFLLVFSGFKFDFADKSHLEVRFELFSALLFLLLLALELADKVTMKRDLEIAREIQTWLVPSAPPIVENADVAFSTRPQNSVAGDYYDAFYPLGNSG